MMPRARAAGPVLFPPEFFRALERLGRRPARAGAGRAAGWRRGAGLPGFDRRPFRPGEDLRLVDWRASARSRSALVRLREEERGGELLLLLDRSASLCPRHGRRDDDQRRLALALGWLQLQSGGTVRLCAGGPPRLFAGFERRAALQRALEELPPPAGGDEALPIAPARGPAPRLVALTDPWSGEPWWRSLKAAARRSAESLSVTLVLAEEDEPPAEGLRLLPVEGGPPLTVDLAAGRAAYARRWEEWLQQRHRRCAALGVRALELRCAAAGAPATAILEAASLEGLV